MPKKIFREPRSEGRKDSLISGGRGGRGGGVSGAAQAPLRVRDVAALCGVEQKTVHNWVARGMIPHFRTPGRHLRFSPDEVAKFVASCRSEGRAGEPIPAVTGGGTTNVVVVVVPGAAGERRARGELLSLRRALPESRIVWLGEASPRALPANVERARTAAELRDLLAGTRPRGLGARDRHRRNPERR